MSARITRFSLLFLLILAWPAFAEGARPLLWEVRSAEGRTVAHLLGSIHVARADLYPLHPSIEQSFGSARSLVLEIDPGQLDLERLLASDLQKGSCKDVESRLDENSRKRLKREAGKLGIPPEMFALVPPGMLAAELVLGEATAHGYSPTHGIDNHFISLAGKKGKRILALESIDEQLALLMECESGLLSLKNTLLTLDEVIPSLEAMTAAWREGDAAALERLAISEPLAEHPELRPYFERYFFQRNQRMVEKVQKFIAAGEAPFVVVGAGHLLGDRGLVALLQRRGYQVSQM